MKIYKDVVKSETEPTNQNVLWLKDNTLYHFDGGWVPITGSVAIAGEGTNTSKFNINDHILDLGEFNKENLGDFDNNIYIYLSDPKLIRAIRYDIHFITFSVNISSLLSIEGPIRFFCPKITVYNESKGSYMCVFKGPNTAFHEYNTYYIPGAVVIGSSDTEATIVPIILTKEDWDNSSEFDNLSLTSALSLNTFKND